MDIINDNIHNKKEVPHNWEVNNVAVEYINRDGVNGTVISFAVRVFENDNNYSFTVVRAEVRTRFTVQVDGHTFVCDDKKHNFYRLFLDAYPQIGCVMRENNGYSDKQEWAQLEHDVESWMGWKYSNGL